MIIPQRSSLTVANHLEITIFSDRRQSLQATELCSIVFPVAIAMPMLCRALPNAIYRQICTLSIANFNCMINAFLENGRLDCARKLFDRNPAARNIVAWNKMITGYIRNNEMQRARELFDEMPVRDIVSWNSVLSGLQKAENPGDVYQFFLDMRRVGFIPNEYTVSTVITAILGTKFHVLVPQIQTLIVCSALNTSVFVGSALMRGYAIDGDKVGLARVFDEILVKNVESWNALISGYIELRCIREAQQVFDEMPERNVVSWTALVNGYMSNKKFDKAWSIFNQMGDKNVVSWTVMIKGYVVNGKFLDGLRMFLLMVRSGIQPNHFTFSSVFEACAGCSSLLMGLQVHSRFIKSGVAIDVILSTSIVDMYAKCGNIEAAICIFDSIPDKNLVSWNSMIGGYARQGLGTRALEVFERMKKDGVRPDQVTFINVLSACGHGAMIKEGEMQFKSMEKDYGIAAKVEHYACMVDLYGRAGELEKAEKLMKTMPFEPDLVVWSALLGACGLHSSLESGEFAAKGISKMKKDHPVVYSMLSKIHSENGAWNNVIELRKLMNLKRVKKQKASSWVESSYG